MLEMVAAGKGLIKSVWFNNSFVVNLSNSRAKFYLLAPENSSLILISRKFIHNHVTIFSRLLKPDLTTQMQKQPLVHLFTVHRFVTGFAALSSSCMFSHLTKVMLNILNHQIN